MSKTEVFERRVELPVSVDELFDWHTREGAFQRMTPPWEPTKVVSNDGVVNGGRSVMEMHVGPTTQRWIAEHKEVVRGQGFVDEQVDGPFKSWRHEHRMEALGPARSALVDHIEYVLPLGAVGHFFGEGIASRRLDTMFTYRHAVLLEDLSRHAEYRGVKKRIAITGASGMLGRAIAAMLSTGGHELLRVVRHGEGGIEWDARSSIEADKLRGVDAVIHLAGENIGDGRWTDEKKRKILESRVDGTALIARTLAALEDGPRTLVSASASGFYGHRSSPVDETSPRGDGFLAEVCDEWEHAADPAREAGLRVVHPRIGIVLTPEGGALPPLKKAVSAGIGGPIGKGDQGFSWIALDDVVYALFAMVMRDDLAGPVNVTSPHPVDSAGLAKALGHVLHRPSFMPLPAAAVKVAFGERGECLLLDGAVVDPRRLVEAHHRFAYPELDSALRHLLGKPDAT
ncbi:MAG: TIGR01777 family oxidoreductase [Polyangia bacterium]